MRQAQCVLRLRTFMRSAGHEVAGLHRRETTSGRAGGDSRRFACVRFAFRLMLTCTQKEAKFMHRLLACTTRSVCLFACLLDDC
jgi:hypothetical protein